MALSGDRLQRILNTYDTALKDAEDATLERIYAALDGAARELESRLTKSYAKYQGTPGLLPNQRMLLIRQEIAEYMALLKPEERGAIEANFERMLAEAAGSGINLSQELINATTNTNVAPFATVNLEAVKFQAQDAAKRLYRWSDEYQNKISGIVEMHLAVGSGPQKVASTLRNELGITKGRAEAIARTESLSSFDSATRENYKRNDVAYISRIATQDSRTCSYCAARAGKVYRVDEAPAALHPNDRCYSAPWKPEWAALGLVDNAWMENHAADVQAQVEARGEKLNVGPSPFERANGLQPPKAVWSPGDPLPTLPEKPKPAPAPKAKTPKEPKPPKPTTKYPARLPASHAIALTPRWKASAIDQALNTLNTEGAAERVGQFRQFVKDSGVQAIFYDSSRPFYEQKSAIEKGLKVKDPSWTAIDLIHHTSIRRESSSLGFTYPSDNHVVIATNLRDFDSARKEVELNAPVLNAGTKTLIEVDAEGAPAWGTSDIERQGTDTQAFMTYLHEMGHRVHAAAGTPVSPAKIKDTFTEYGGVNDFEFFAEHFTMWMVDAKALREANPDIADFIEETMEKALKATAKGQTKSAPKQAPTAPPTPRLQELYAKLDSMDPSSSEWYKTLLEVETEEKKATEVAAKRTATKKPTPQTLEKAGQKRFTTAQKKIDALLAEDEAERQRRVDELVRKFKAKGPESEGLNFTDEYMKVLTSTSRAVSEMEKFRKSLIGKGLSSDEARTLVDEIEVDLPEKFAPFVDQLKDDLTEFFQITKGKGSKSLATIIKDSDRAYAHEDGTLNVGTDINNKTVMFHEAGHHIEFEDDDIRVAMQDWMKSRAESLTPVSLNKLLKGGGFDRTEKAYKGDYIDPYVGKVYDDGYTEVLAMGIQHFASAKSMLELYRKDPGMFNLILGVILK